MATCKQQLRLRMEATPSLKEHSSEHCRTPCLSHWGPLVDIYMAAPCHPRFFCVFRLRLSEFSKLRAPALPVAPLHPRAWRGPKKRGVRTATCESNSRGAAALRPQRRLRPGPRSHGLSPQFVLEMKVSEGRHQDRDQWQTNLWQARWAIRISATGCLQQLSETGRWIVLKQGTAAAWSSVSKLHPTAHGSVESHYTSLRCASTILPDIRRSEPHEEERRGAMGSLELHSRSSCTGQTFSKKDLARERGRSTELLRWRHWQSANVMEWKRIQVAPAAGPGRALVWCQTWHDGTLAEGCSSKRENQSSHHEIHRIIDDDSFPPLLNKLWTLRLRACKWSGAEKDLARGGHPGPCMRKAQSTSPWRPMHSSTKITTRRDILQHECMEVGYVLLCFSWWCCFYSWVCLNFETKSKSWWWFGPNPELLRLSWERQGRPEGRRDAAGMPFK